MNIPAAAHVKERQTLPFFLENKGFLPFGTVTFVIRRYDGNFLPS